MTINKVVYVMKNETFI